MIIKQCLQKKPENRASIDEIIFSEDFQQKAKINKITLPKHLNKHKLLQSLQTKKQLDSEERKLIIDLSERGFLPRAVINEPSITMAQMEENYQSQGNINKQLSSEAAMASN